MPELVSRRNEQIVINVGRALQAWCRTDATEKTFKLIVEDIGIPLSAIQLHSIVICEDEIIALDFRILKRSSFRTSICTVFYRIIPAFSVVPDKIIVAQRKVFHFVDHDGIRPGGMGMKPTVRLSVRIVDVAARDTNILRFQKVDSGMKIPWAPFRI